MAHCMGIKKIFVLGSAVLLISNIGMFFLTMETPLWVAAGLNVIRNIYIGCLMMPLLTYGASNVQFGRVAAAASVLASLRAIAASGGCPLCVGIMRGVSSASRASYGDAAWMQGMNRSLLCVAAGGFVLLRMAVFAGGET